MRDFEERRVVFCLLVDYLEIHVSLQNVQKEKINVLLLLFETCIFKSAIEYPFVIARGFLMRSAEEKSPGRKRDARRDMTLGVPCNRRGMPSSYPVVDDQSVAVRARRAQRASYRSSYPSGAHRRRAGTWRARRRRP